MARKLDSLRNLGIIAHIDAGKTTVTERMLFYSGAKHRVGQVDFGTTETDVDPEEQQRGITIYSACVTFDWRDVHINLIDTPGHVDFTAEVERCLRVLDGAVVVFSAREGVEAQSETVWRQANRYHVPRLAFINKMDREGADFYAVFEEIRERLEARPVAVQVPAGSGPAHVADRFRGVIDLVTMRLRTFDPDSEGKTIVESEIPDELFELASEWRERMLDELYNFSDELMELALQQERIPEELVRKVLRQATLGMQIQPVFCGAALHGIGVQPVLDGVQYYLPSPGDVPPVEGRHPQTQEFERRRAEPDEPFCGIVFKVLPAKTGDLSWVRVYSGQLKANTRVLNPAKQKKENVAQLWHIHATKKAQQVEVAQTGDIVGVIGLRHSITGDTLCDAKRPLQLETIEFPESVISMAIEPENTAERKKLGDVLEMLRRQDPTLHVSETDAGQTLISGMGELHLEVVKNRLLRDFNLNVKFHKPQVSYRETIDRAVEVEGHCHRHLAGKLLVADVRLRLEPVEDGGQAVSVGNRCPPERLSAGLLEATLEELRSCAVGGGPIAGFPLTKLRVILLDARLPDDGGEEPAVRIAANDAFQKALEEGGQVLLEPIMRVSITTPQEYLGEFVGDLQQRRAIIARTDHRGAIALIEAHAPLKELFGYSSAMRSLSQGRASASMEPLEYAPAPPDVVREYRI